MSNMLLYVLLVTVVSSLASCVQHIYITNSSKSDIVLALNDSPVTSSGTLSKRGIKHVSSMKQFLSIDNHFGLKIDSAAHGNCIYL
jgi:hypothetical protein